MGLGLSGLSLTQVLQKLSGNGAATSRIVQDLGNKGGSALRALVATVPGIEQVNAQLANSAGEGQRVADTLDGTFSGAVKRFTTSFDNLAGDLAKPLLDPLAKQFALASTAVTDFTKTADFGKIRDAILEFVTGAVGGITTFIKSFNFSSASASIASFIKTSGDYFKSFTDGINGVARVASGLGNTIGTVFNAAKGAIASLVGAAVEGTAGLYKAYEGLRVIQGATKAEIDALEQTYQNLRQTGDGILADSQKSYAAAGKNITGIADAITGAGNVVATAAPQVKSFTDRVIEAAAAGG